MVLVLATKVRPQFQKNDGQVDEETVVGEAIGLLGSVE